MRYGTGQHCFGAVDADWQRCEVLAEHRRERMQDRNVRLASKRNVQDSDWTGGISLETAGWFNCHSGAGFEEAEADSFAVTPSDNWSKTQSRSWQIRWSSTGSPSERGWRTNVQTIRPGTSCASVLIKVSNRVQVNNNVYWFYISISRIYLCT